MIIYYSFFSIKYRFIFRFWFFNGFSRYSKFENRSQTLVKTPSSRTILCGISRPLSTSPSGFSTSLSQTRRKGLRRCAVAAFYNIKILIGFVGRRKRVHASPRTSRSTCHVISYVIAIRPCGGMTFDVRVFITIRPVIAWQTRQRIKFTAAELC